MLDKDRGLYVAHSENGPLSLVGKMINRHGLIAGATGTGKTVTLQVMAETFSQAGIPCFMADMKGDLSGISQTGKLSGFIEKRLPEFGIENPQFQPCPVRFFDVYGEQGHPMRSTISRMGPEMLGRLMELNETQTGVLNIVFRIADDNGLLLIDLKDLRAMLNFVGQNAAEYTTKYGNVTSASVGAIQRALLALENQGADKFFGEPDFDIYDLLQCEGGKGIMNVLAADRLMLQPKLYSTFLLWLLSELYATLPEVGDMDLPKLVFFFDEAHMLFEGTSKALTDKIEQVIRLIRSKGVGIYFITQSPTDIPSNILGQLGNRVQHALRAYSPQDQKAVKVAADTFRPNPAFKTYDTLLELGTGEALVSFLDEKGTPSIVERAKILFPLSQIGAITEDQRADLIKRSRLYGRYDHVVDRESAYEIITAATLEAERQKAEIEAAEEAERQAAAEAKEAARAAKEQEKLEKEKAKKAKNSIASKVLKSVITAVTGVAAAAAADAITGKKSSSKTSTTKKAVTKATKSATSTLTRELTRGLVPEGVHIVQGHVGEFAAAAEGFGLDVVEAAAELFAGAAQGGFRVHAIEAGGIDDGEQQVSEFSFDVVLAAFCAGFRHFRTLFRHFSPDVFFLLPVKTAAAGLFLHGKGLQNGGHGLGDAAHDGFVAILFLGFHQFPGIGDFLGRRRFASFGTEDMRMAEHHLVAYFVNAVGNVKRPFFLPDACIEDHVVQQVANLLGRSLAVSLQDGVAEFIDFLFRHGTDGIHGLGGVPGAFYAKSVHDIQQSAKGGQLFFPSMHSIHFRGANIQRISLSLSLKCSNYPISVPWRPYVPYGAETMSTSPALPVSRKSLSRLSASAPENSPACTSITSTPKARPLTARLRLPDRSWTRAFSSGPICARRSGREWPIIFRPTCLKHS